MYNEVYLQWAGRGSHKLSRFYVQNHHSKQRDRKQYLVDKDNITSGKLFSLEDQNAPYMLIHKW